MVQTTSWTTVYRVPTWLPADTEESIVGTEWHQEAIGALADLLREVARRRQAPWGVCEQIGMVGLQYADGRPYEPRPDVLVLPRPLPSGALASLPLSVGEAPLFIAEVASNSTKGHDVGEKRRVYAAIGVPEYLVFDPLGSLLPEPVQAWRLDEGVSVPWLAAADGWWHSSALDVAFRPMGRFLRVRDRDGSIVELSHEVRRLAQHLAHQLQQAQERLAEAERRLAELRAHDGTNERAVSQDGGT